MLFIFGIRVGEGLGGGGRGLSCRPPATHYGDSTSKMASLIICLLPAMLLGLSVCALVGLSIWLGYSQPGGVHAIVLFNSS